MYTSMLIMRLLLDSLQLHMTTYDGNPSVVKKTLIEKSNDQEYIAILSEVVTIGVFSCW
jgi:hypothetical protein